MRVMNQTGQPRNGVLIHLQSAAWISAIQLCQKTGFDNYIKGDMSPGIAAHVCKQRKLNYLKLHTQSTNIKRFSPVAFDNIIRDLVLLHAHHHHHQVARPVVSIAVSTTELHLERSCARSHAELRPRLVGCRSDSMVRSHATSIHATILQLTHFVPQVTIF